MRPFWSFLASCMKFLRVQRALPRFGLVFVFFCSLQQMLIGKDCMTSQKNICGGGGGAACGTASFQSNCPNHDRSQLICLFPSRVSVSRTIKPILETGCCAKQRPPDFFSQKVILFCVTGIKWIIHFWKTLFYELFVYHPGFFTVQQHHVSIFSDAKVQ